MRIKKGSIVITEHGEGVIIEKDLPKSRSYSWLVKITKPNTKGREILKSDLFKKYTHIKIF